MSIFYVDDLASKIFDDDCRLFVNDYQKNLVQSKLRMIGQSILESTKKTSEGLFKPRWDEKRVCDSALGYNDAQQMVVFAANIPTYSITAFWANGQFGMNKWQGLFQRTDKD